MVIPDLSKKSDAELRSWIENHETKGVTGTPLYLALVEEEARRKGRGLKTSVSLEVLKQAARDGKFIAYGDLAEANAVPWSQARHLMNGAHGHLDNLLSICHANGLPLLPSICVNQGGVRTGALSDEALAGFAKGAERLGYAVTDRGAFLRKCQQACFEWGRQAK